MDIKTYVENAINTESPAGPVLERLIAEDAKDSIFTPNYVDQTVVQLNEFIVLSKKLDMVKKKIFYNKDISEPLWYAIEGTHVMKPMPDFAQGEGDVEFVRLLHAIIGITTEAGELVEALLEQKLDKVNVMEELGDVMWYVAIACHTLDIDPTEMLQINIDKLRKRFPNKFTEYDADNRDLDAERDILEGNEGCPACE